MSLSVNSVGYGYAPTLSETKKVSYDNQTKTDLLNSTKHKKENKKGTSTLTKVGILTALAIGADYLFFKGKHVKGLLSKLGLMGSKTAEGTKTITKTAEEAKAATKLEHAQQKAVEGKEVITPKNKKHRIKHTSDRGASKPITNEQEAKVVQNIETKHTNATTRKTVEQAQKDVVTPEMQAKYNQDIAYKPMTQEEKIANDVNKAKNREQAAVLNSVENNSKGGEKLADVKKTMEAAEKTARSVLKDGEYVLDGNKYVIQGGKVKEMTLKGALKPQNKPVKIEQHLEKNNVLERLLKGEGTNTAETAMAA